MYKGEDIKKYSRQHIGEVHTTTEGYQCRVTSGGSRLGYCTIRIENWEKEASYVSAKEGSVKYPFHPSVYSVGYIGVGTYSYTLDTKAHITWNNMLRRCYSLRYQELHPTYKGVTVCKEWHNFQSFADWFTDNYRDGWHLDKDLLSGDVKVYSPETCVFIPQALNKFLTNIKYTNTSGFIGVSWSSSRNGWCSEIMVDSVRKRLGVFNTKEEASCAYTKAREDYAKQLRTRYKDVLPAQALQNIT